jgi:hypothetical protein
MLFLFALVRPILPVGLQSAGEIKPKNGSMPKSVALEVAPTGLAKGANVRL